MATSEHVWVMHTIVPVAVVASEEGPVVEVDETLERSLLDKGAVGCDACGVSLAEAFGRPCGAVQEGLDQLLQGDAPESP